jgi:lipopolysaccharide export system protein LptA
MRRRGTILATIVALAGLAGSTALAQVQQQGAVSALKGHDSNAPIDVEANPGRLEVQSRADRAVFVGKVHATQGDMTLDTQRLTVAYSTKQPNQTSQTNGSGVQINRIDAAGGVVVRSPSETAKGDFGIYDLDRRLITLLGNVQLNQGANQINGARLVIDLDTGRAVVDGGPPGVNSTGGRVSGHFTVPQRQPQQPRH